MYIKIYQLFYKQSFPIYKHTLIMYVVILPNDKKECDVYYNYFILDIFQLDNTSLELRRILHIDRHTYCYLLDLVSPLIEKQDTLMRCAILPAEGLDVTMRYLATGTIKLLKITYIYLKVWNCNSNS